MGYSSFEDLEVWKRSARLVVQVYDVVRDCRDSGLQEQVTKATVSIASHIAEGAEGESRSDSMRFMPIAQGASAALRTQVYSTQRQGVFSAPHASELVSE